MRDIAFVYLSLTFIPLIHCAPNGIVYPESVCLNLVESDGSVRGAKRRDEAIGRAVADNIRRSKLVGGILRVFYG
jgi:hypothetical protein